jgi:hypothetical protein
MSWYYAGPEAKPVGPVSVEELHNLRVSGTVSGDTYILEHTGQPGATLAWKRYHEVFPTSLSPAPLPQSLPPIQPPPPVPPPAAPPPVTAPAPATHPLFPSAGPAVPPTVYPPYAVPPAAPSAQAIPPYVPPPAIPPPAPVPGLRTDPHYAVRPTNSWCAWGFGLGLVGFFLSFVCGIGLLPALLAILLCIVGLVQLQHRHDQAGHGLAVMGLVLSGIALLISLIFVLTFSIPILKAHQETVNEETPSDSQ